MFYSTFFSGEMGAAAAAAAASTAGGGGGGAVDGSIASSVPGSAIGFNLNHSSSSSASAASSGVPQFKRGEFLISHFSCCVIPTIYKEFN